MPKAVVVGAGGVSNGWFPPLRQEKVNVVGVVDVNIQNAYNQIAKYELDCPASTDLKATLHATKPDFVVDLTTPQAHCKVVCTALRVGCHVIGEKPMAASMAEGRRMVRTAQEAGRLYMVSQSRRYAPTHHAAWKMFSAGRIGELTTANCDFYIGAHFGGFRDQMASPLLLDMAIHHFDLLRYLTGTDPVAVYAREFNPKGSWYKGDVAVNCIFEMTRGLVFTYRGSWCAEGCHTSWNGDWRFIGEHGTILMEKDQLPNGEVVVGKTGFDRQKRTIKSPKPTLKYWGQHGALREMLTFLRTGQKPQTPCQDNIQSLAMVFAAMESSRKGRRVPVKAM